VGTDEEIDRLLESLKRRIAAPAGVPGRRRSKRVEA
jgi:hypothetical protein